MSLKPLRVRQFKRVILPLAAVLAVLIAAWRLQLPLRILGSKVLYLLASRQITREQYARALPLLQCSVKLYPRLAYAHNDLGYIYHRWGRIEQAEAAYRQAIAANPAFATAYSNLGFSRLEAGQIEAARQALEQAAALDPERAAVWSNLGTTEQLAGRPERALLAYQAAVRLDPQNAAAQANLGALYYQQGQFQNAQEHLSAALRAQPDLAPARATLGAIALSSADLKYARSELYSVAADLGGDPLYHFYLALLYRAGGEQAKAEQELGTVLALDPDPGLVVQARAHLAALDSSSGSSGE